MPKNKPAPAPTHTPAPTPTPTPEAAAEEVRDLSKIPQAKWTLEELQAHARGDSICKPKQARPKTGGAYEIKDGKLLPTDKKIGNAAGLSNDDAESDADNAADPEEA